MFSTRSTSAYLSKDRCDHVLYKEYFIYLSKDRCDHVLYKEYFIYLSKDMCDHGRYMGAFNVPDVRQT